MTTKKIYSGIEFEVCELPESQKKESNLQKHGFHSNSCEVCGKPTSGKFWVEMSTDWLCVKNPDEKCFEESQGSFPIGSECRKLFAPGYIKEMKFIIE